MNYFSELFKSIERLCDKHHIYFSSEKFDSSWYFYDAESQNFFTCTSHSKMLKQMSEVDSKEFVSIKNTLQQKVGEKIFGFYIKDYNPDFFK